MTGAEFDRHCEDVKTEGYTVLPAALTSEECDAATVELERLAEEKNRGGFECVFNKARVFERAYQVPSVVRLVRHFLGGDAVLCAVHGSVIEPGHGGGRLHADGEVTGHLRSRSQAAADEGRRITSHAMSINTIFCVGEFTATNGATRLVPGSHKVESIEIPENAAQQARIVEAERGSAILFHANIWHGSSENRSSKRRYAMIAPWRRNWSRGPYELCRMVEPEVLERAGAEGRRVFGSDALQPYLEHWQWDRETGGPKPEFGELRRD